jgi:hypothetical protein
MPDSSRRIGKIDRYLCLFEIKNRLSEKAINQDELEGLGLPLCNGSSNLASWSKRAQQWTKDARTYRAVDEQNGRQLPPVL